MRILVTGSREWNDMRTIEAALVDAARDHFSETTLVHGGARGADQISAYLGGQYGMNVEVHHADWNRYKKRAGFVRNAEMVEAGADVCLAFIKNESKGATMCADLAEKAGIRTVRFTA